MAVHLRPRLAAAAAMVPEGCRAVADIGCDHGRLGVALLQQGRCERVIAADIGEAPLKRARALYARCGLTERAEIRMGDGLSVLRPGEADAVCICGMGGALMARILAAASPPLMGAKVCILQPMRGVEDIRRWLYENRYRIVTDRVIKDAGRYYQVFSAVPGERDTIPPGWPGGCFDLGHHALGDPLLPDLAKAMLAQHELRLRTAGGTRGEALLREKAAWMERILELCEQREDRP